jgi:hypothetical protein
MKTLWSLYAMLLMLVGCTTTVPEGRDRGGTMTPEQEDAYVAEMLAADAQPEDPR